MRTVIAFLSGAAVVSLVFLLLLGEEESAEPAGFATETLVPATARDSQFPPEGQPIDLEAARGGELPQTATFVQPPAPGSTIEPAPLRPIWLPKEFAWYATTQSFFDFQNQDIDPDWSLQTERQISDYLTAKPEITSKYGVPIVHGIPPPSRPFRRRRVRLDTRIAWR